MEYPHGNSYWSVYAADKVRNPGTGQDRTQVSMSGR